MPTTTIRPVPLETRILLDHRGVAWVEGTNTKVKEIVLDKIAYGWSPEEIHFQHPHLSLAHIHAALAYYHEHKEELDAEIERDYQEYLELRRQAGESPMAKRLRQAGLLCQGYACMMDGERG
ncbi:MAG: DUF433 domain-containing protein [Armatimonadetes bacterium]|nr:DUF433 domain-containing protein [Armatimonadota bacterium]